MKLTSEHEGKKSVLLFKQPWLVWLVELCFFKARRAFFYKEMERTHKTTFALRRYANIATHKLVVMQYMAAYLVSTHLFPKFSIFFLQSLFFLRQGTWKNHHCSKI